MPPAPLMTVMAWESAVSPAGDGDAGPAASLLRTDVLSKHLSWMASIPCDHHLAYRNQASAKHAPMPRKVFNPLSSMFFTEFDPTVEVSLGSEPVLVEVVWPPVVKVDAAITLDMAPLISLDICDMILESRDNEGVLA